MPSRRLFQSLKRLKGIFMAAAIFAQEGGLITGSWKLLGLHVAGLLIVTVFTFVMTCVGIWLIRLITEPEISREVGSLGLDFHQLDEGVP